MAHSFTAIVHKEEKLYVAECPEIGTASQGHTIEEAVANLNWAVSNWAWFTAVTVLAAPAVSESVNVVDASVPSKWIINNVKESIPAMAHLPL